MRDGKKLSIKSIISRVIMITIGAIIMAVGLQGILIPNNIIDGGITGISMIIAKVTGIKLGILLFVLNLPFFFLGYKQIGKKFSISMAYGICILSLSTGLIGDMKPLISDTLLALVFGGLMLGVGVGIVLRNGGVLDGTETLALLIEKKAPVTVGEIIMIFNVIIFSSAIFVFGLERALYSMLTYYIAFKTIDIVMKGLDEMKAMYLISDYGDEIAFEIKEQLDRGVTFIDGEGIHSGEEKRIVFCVFTRLEESKVKDIIRDIDTKAFVIITDVSDVKGGRFKNKALV